MDCIHVRDFRRADYTIGPQIAVGAFGATNADRFISELNVKRLDVGLRIDGEGLDAHFAASADDAKRDFTAVGDEDLLDHTGIKS